MFAAVRDFDVAVEQQVLLGGEVVEEHVVLHAHPHVLPDHLLVGPDVFAIHKDGAWRGREQPGQNRSEGKINRKGKLEKGESCG